MALTSQATPAGQPDGKRAGRRRRSRRRWAGYAVLLVALFGVGSVYGLATSRPGAAAAGDPNAQITHGKALFLQGCSSCHGLAAQGGEEAPSLIGVGAAAVDFQVSTGRMPLKTEAAEAVRKTPRYTPEETAALAAYIASLAPGPAIPGQEDYTPGSSANLGVGGNLFRTNCASCHNFVGAGGALADGKHAPDLGKATDKEIYEAMITGPGTMPVFPDSQLNSSQKKDIIAYVQHVKSEPNPGGAGIGRVGPVTEGLVAFLGGMGALAFTAMWIGARAKRAS